MTITGFDMLFYTVGFVVPGFVWCSMVAMLVPQKSDQSQISLLRFLTFSCVNYALWSWLIYLLIKSEFFTEHPVRSAFAWGLIILISPLVLGLAMGHFSQKAKILQLLRRLGLSPMHPVPTAWDYKFGNTKDAVWVLVTLKDGKQVAGLFGSKSFASSDAAERDIYIQSVYRISEHGPWERAPQNDGILIPSSEIKHVEFWSDEEDNNA